MAESVALCSSIQSFESNSAVKSVCATISLIKIVGPDTGSAVPGEPRKNVLARQLPA